MNLASDVTTVVMSAWVPGLAKTKGSLEHLGGGRVRESVAGSSAWRVMMVERFSAAIAWRGDVRPVISSGVRVHVSATFDLPVDPVSVGSGDVDKLLRNVFDALSAHGRKCSTSCRKHSGVYADDVQVVSVSLAKRRAGERGPGVQVTVATIGG